MAHLLNHINYILGNNSSGEIAKLRTDMNLRDEVGLDSFDMAELTVRLEMEYGIDIFEGGVVYTVGEILRKLEKENVKE